MYNLLIDEESLDNSDFDMDEESEISHGYKQMILVLQSQCVETGKSFFFEILSRLFHCTKRNIHSVLSFESAKMLLSRSDPVIIGKTSSER